MAEIQGNAGKAGSIQIADEVIAIIAGTAALETDGVVSTSAHGIGDIAGILGKKNLSKGVKVTVNGNEAEIDITILVRFGCNIKAVSEDVQKRVKNAVETMTGLDVTQVNMTVCGVVKEKEKPAAE